MGNDLGRRVLLRCGAACALAACGKFVDEPVAIETGAPARGLLSVPMARMPELTRAGGVPAAAGGAVPFTVQQRPGLAQVGGSVTGHAAGVPFPVVVLRASASQMLAFDARCPHLGCAVRGAQQLFICPCHGSLFNLDGSVKLGPATGPLTALQVTFDGTQVVVRVPA